MRRVNCIAALMAAMVGASAAFAQNAPAVTVGNAWSRATSASAGTGGVYLSLSATAAADRVTGASSPVAERAELHETVNENGVMKMLPVPALAVEPGRPVTMKPGGLHIMLMGLKQPLRRGERFPLSLTFEKSAPVTVSVIVEGPGASGPAMDHGSMNHGSTGREAPKPK